MPRGPDPEEAALWARGTSTVRPLNRKPVASPLSASPASPVPPAAKLLRTVQPPAHAAQPARAVLANTLDGGWDRRISAGRITPDVTIDLHGYNLVSAHAVLERRLGEAIAHGDRVMLVITGRPPRPGQDPERPRGLIRQQLPHWLAASAIGRAHV